MKFAAARIWHIIIYEIYGIDDLRRIKVVVRCLFLRKWLVFKGRGGWAEPRPVPRSLLGAGFVNEVVKRGRADD